MSLIWNDEIAEIYGLVRSIENCKGKSKYEGSTQDFVYIAVVINDLRMAVTSRILNV